MELIVIIWLACGLAAAAVASGKGRSAGGWFILGALLGPFAILGIAIASPDETTQKAQKLASGQLRTCPACAEAVQAAAIKCRHCGEALTPVQAQPPLISPGAFFGIVLVILIALAAMVG